MACLSHFDITKTWLFFRSDGYILLRIISESHISAASKHTTTHHCLRGVLYSFLCELLYNMIAIHLEKATPTLSKKFQISVSFESGFKWRLDLSLLHLFPVHVFKKGMLLNICCIAKPFARLFDYG